VGLLPVRGATRATRMTHLTLSFRAGCV
jgi:hypothetical protein